MELTETDRELLELVTLQVPWYVVCGDFHRRFGSPGALARRIMELEYGGLLEVRETTPGAGKPSAEALERDALEHGCYDDLTDTWEPMWEIMATDEGFAMIEDRLDRE